VPFSRVFTSPLRRAFDTCRIAGLADRATLDEDLVEWDYGECEGKTAEQIRATDPGWNIWDSGVRGGETVEQVGARVDRVLARAIAVPGDVALVAHAHLLRILAARWIGLAPIGGRYFALHTASISILGRDPVVTQWNDISHLRTSQ